MPRAETSRELRITEQRDTRVPVLGGLLERGRTIPVARPRLAALGVAAVGLAGTYAYASFLEDVYTIRLWLTWRVLQLWFWVAVWNLGCASFGQFVLARMLKLRNLPALEGAVVGMAVGVISFALAMFAGG